MSEPRYDVERADDGGLWLMRDGLPLAYRTRVADIEEYADGAIFGPAILRALRRFKAGAETQHTPEQAEREP